MGGEGNPQHVRFGEMMDEAGEAPGWGFVGPFICQS